MKPSETLTPTREEQIRSAFRETAENIRAVCDGAYVDHVTRTVDIIVEAFCSGHKLLVFGNGGSASDAQHIAAELVGRFQCERRGLAAIALTADQSVLTALGNDYGYNSVFERQIEAHGQHGDVAWGISTSGNSSNVVRALEKARSMGLKTIGLTGLGGGQMASFCDVLLAVPSRETPRIQEIHLMTYHSICEAVEKAIFPHDGVAASSR